MKPTRVTALIAALAILAAACGGSDATTTDDTASTTVADSTTTAAETPDSAPETSEPEEPAEPLTASFRGVTADTISIGYTSVDFEKLRTNFGADTPYAGFEEIIGALVEDLNSRGGINGRMLTLETRKFLPVGTAEAEVACVSLTEDAQVFAIFNGFTGPGTESVNECITNTHETILIGANPTPEQIAEAKATWVTSEMSLARRAQAIPALLTDADLLDQFGGSIAVVVSSEPERPSADVMQAAFEAMDVEVTSSTTLTTTGDEVATSALIATIVERARADGAGSIFILGEDRFALQALLEYDFPVFLVNADRSSGWKADPIQGLDDSDIIYGSRGEPDIAEPTLANCKEIAEAALGIEIKPSLEVEPGGDDYWAALLGACAQLTIFEALANEAGPVLTNDSFAAALGTVGEIPLPGVEFASLGTDKHDARDALVLSKWNNVDLSWESIGEVIDITKS